MINRELLLRRLLWLTSVFNAAAAYLFAFPASRGGAALGLPAQVPMVYRAATSLFVLFFGAAYVWLAIQPTVVRPLVGFAAWGKAGAFTLVSVLWLAGEATVRLVAMASGDLVFAVLFVWCLAGCPAEPVGGGGNTGGPGPR